MGILSFSACYCGYSLKRLQPLFNLQDEADDSDAPHVRLQAHRLEADHLRGHKFRRPVHHHQRFIIL